MTPSACHAPPCHVCTRVSRPGNGCWKSPACAVRGPMCAMTTGAHTPWRAVRDMPRMPGALWDDAFERHWPVAGHGLLEAVGLQPSRRRSLDEPPRGPPPSRPAATHVPSLCCRCARDGQQGPQPSGDALVLAAPRPFCPRLWRRGCTKVCRGLGARSPGVPTRDTEGGLPCRNVCPGWRRELRA